MTEELKEIKSSSRWKDITEKLGIVKFVGTLVFGAALGWTALQLTMASQAFAMQDLKSKLEATNRRIDDAATDQEKSNNLIKNSLDSVRKEGVTRELFEERTNRILEELREIKSKQGTKNYDVPQ
jgi:hypothetical protein